MCASVILKCSPVHRARRPFRAVAAGVAMLIAGSGAVYAGPCTGKIAELEKAIRQAAATAVDGGAGAPSAPQTVGAQLHHQPTPGAVQSAERQANIDGEAALERAHKADAAGDAKACENALRQARDLYGL